jgi:hypothetical protein
LQFFLAMPTPNQAPDLHRAQAAFLTTAIETAEAFLLWSGCFAHGDQLTKDIQTNYLRLLRVLAKKGEELNAIRESTAGL